MNPRLVELANVLELLYQKLAAFEKELALSSSPLVKFEMKQRIIQEIWPSIRRYESEYWSLYPPEAIVIPDSTAERYLRQIEFAVVSIEQTSSANYPPGLVPLLQDIRAKLGEDKSASAKLKIALPLIPAIASYELELDTAKVMQEAWTSIKSWIRK